MNSSFVRHARAAALSAFFLSLAGPAAAQADYSTGATAERPGRITGRIVDAKTGAGVSDAVIRIDGLTIGAKSVIGGRFTLSSVPAGTVTLVVRHIGYAPKQITGVAVNPGEVIEQDVSLEAATVKLTTTVVTASAERGTVNDALDHQRTATAIVNSVTSEQITRSGDGDAAQAVKRVSGVTLQDGKYVFVRGLGERYTTASLNGARIPSPEPEKKVVPLDLFPSGLLESITTTKTFTPDQPGDFSGAQVNVRTREFPGRGMVTWSTGVGYNSAATGKDVIAAPRSGAEWLGFAGNARSLPSDVRSAGDFGSLSPQATNAAAHSFRNAWTPRAQSGDANYSTSVSLGGRTGALGPSIGYLFSGSYGYSQEVRASEIHATAVPDGKGGTIGYNEFKGSSANNAVLWGGLLNLSALFGGNTRLVLNNNFNRSADNEAHQSTGTLDDYGFESVRSSLGFIERTVRSNQIRLERTFGHSQQVELALTSSGVTRREPDHSELQYVREPDPITGAPMPLALFSYNPDGARRIFSDLSETGLASSVDYRIAFGQPGREYQLKVGGSFRGTDRSADNSSYSLLGYRLTRAQREASAEEIFDGRYAMPGSSMFNVLLNSTGGSYKALDRIGATYGMIDAPIGTRLRVIAGARLERAQLQVKSIATSGERSHSALDDTDVLPSLVANLAVGESQSIRISASQTLSRPEYRELSPVTYRDVIEQRDIFGNPDLKRALIRNFDARWEWFPNSGEIVAFGVFAKRFTNPIERVDVATSGASRLGFINADGADNYGMEMEVRKHLGDVTEVLAPITLFTNATVMKSSIDITSDKLSSLTNRKRAMVGQAPYVVNAGMTWSSASARTAATLLYNVVGRRITAAGSSPLPDTYEMARSGVDVSLQTPLFSGISARLDAKNLLDSPFEVRQGTVTREMYRTGRVFSFGLKWQQ
ncbi:MAG: outer membrane beta-barrel protein [Gemmatimonadales bacterium]